MLTFILGLVMTFTVQTKSSVTVSGSVPVGAKADYACTYQKGTVRAGDTATLSLSGLGGLQLQSIQLHLRSNKSSGAGTITILADGQTLFTRTGDYKSWFGSYDNEAFHPIGWSGSRTLNAGQLVIRLVGTANSLYISHYDITYSEPQKRPYSVTLMTDGVPLVLTETAVGSGVVLPELEQRNDWYFEGWTAEDIPEPTADMSPEMIYAAMEPFYPVEDVTLYPAWKDQPDICFVRYAEPSDGYYILEHFGYRMAGTVSNTYVPMTEASDVVLPGELYYVDFSPADATCTIRHFGSGSYIGYTASYGALSAAESQWHYRLLEDSTWLFYAATDGDKVWALYQHGLNPEAWLSAYVLGTDPQDVWSLYRTPDPTQVPRYWSHPWPTALEDVAAPRAERVIWIGLYELHIMNGKKTLYLNK